MIEAAELRCRQIPPLDRDELTAYVKELLRDRDDLLALAQKHGTPLYAIDTAVLTRRAARFKRAFGSVLPGVRIYYALKSNSHPLVVRTLLGEGLGVDVSSGRELNLALECGAQEILFSGPGKGIDELNLALDHADKVTVLMDSFAELEKLERCAAGRSLKVRAGVRLTTKESGLWRKFGIPLETLPEFMQKSDSCPHVDFQGLQFHLSWNLNSQSQVVFIARLGAELARLEKQHLGRLRFIDVGGGFWPEQGEWLQAAATPRGTIRSVLCDGKVTGRQAHFKRTADPIEDFAVHIAAAIKTHIPPEASEVICFEPGRWLCHPAMHILLKVADRKSTDLVITDGGTNAVGWDRFETDYFPVVNLTRPGLKEHDCLIAGSLCTPHDLWGYSYFGNDIREGDVLLVPDQGAYTYSLRQDFIKPLPQAVPLPGKTENRHAEDNSEPSETFTRNPKRSTQKG